MKTLRSCSFKDNFSAVRAGWLNVKRPSSGGSPLKPERKKTGGEVLILRNANFEPLPSVIDFLDVNSELSYSTVVEGLEEFLYQAESRAVT
jgi:hypothetical protein